jgi:hypothetical protein
MVTVELSLTKSAILTTFETDLRMREVFCFEKFRTAT